MWSRMWCSLPWCSLAPPPWLCGGAWGGWAPGGVPMPADAFVLFSPIFTHSVSPSGYVSRCSPVLWSYRCTSPTYHCSSKGQNTRTFLPIMHSEQNLSRSCDFKLSNFKLDHLSYTHHVRTKHKRSAKTMEAPHTRQHPTPNQGGGTTVQNNKKRATFSFHTRIVTQTRNVNSTYKSYSTYPPTKNPNHLGPPNGNFQRTSVSYSLFLKHLLPTLRNHRTPTNSIQIVCILHTHHSVVNYVKRVVVHYSCGENLRVVTW
mmetsp:Transcript_7528/g.10387  ORF Transcript_7528/g.10387 Transcript_7528/m.10387 type:complete len:259 (+) Transcript_7528:1398-2174(+)